MLNYSNTAGSKVCQAFSNTAMEDVPFQKDDPDMSQKKTDILPKGCINNINIKVLTFLELISIRNVLMDCFLAQCSMITLFNIY
jgi:hypothetical protein